MRIFNGIEKWGDAHHPKLLDLVRMALGVFLLVKGYVFLQKEPFLHSLIVETNAMALSSRMIRYLIDYVILTHMICGVLIFLGLATRLAVIVQFPVVFGAVFFVNILQSFFNSELWLSVLIMLLLVLFLIIGSGS